MDSLFNNRVAVPEITIFRDKWIIVFSEYELAVQSSKDLDTFINYTIIAKLGQQ